jgi:putative ABC transport system permease protein
MRRASRLRPGDVRDLALLGLRGRPLRTALSVAGIGLGVATVVSVLGIAGSSRAQLVAEIDRLGTNMLTVTPNQSLSGGTAVLPRRAPAMIRRIGPVLSASAIDDVGAPVHAYRNDRISSVDTAAISIYAAQTSLVSTVQAHLAAGTFLNAATSSLPALVLGSDAASALGIDRVDPPVQIWVGNRFLSVVGILAPLPLAPDLNRSVLVGLPFARRFLGADGAPAEIYVRAAPATVDAVQSVLAATADPDAPQDVTITNPSDALVARADASSAFESLFLALGVVALVVGGVGIANVMLIGVLERRAEIGLRRALGARRRHVALQFVAESVAVTLLGGTAGAIIGGFATAVYAASRHWTAVVPPGALAGAVGAGLVVGAVAGLYPAVRAARLSPSEALRTI